MVAPTHVLLDPEPATQHWNLPGLPGWGQQIVPGLQHFGLPLLLLQQTALLEAAQVVTSELRLETVLQLLVDQVSELLSGDAADCYLYDAERRTLRCAAVHGLDPTLIFS